MATRRRRSSTQTPRHSGADQAATEPEVRRTVELCTITRGDFPFLCRSGLDRERAGVQYAAWEYMLQPVIAPLRYLRSATRDRSRIVRVDGRRAGYIGLNPLSGNIEYYLQPWARGGVGSAVLDSYLRWALPFDRPRSAVMLLSNERSQRAFRSSLGRLGLGAPDDYEESVGRGHRRFTIRAGASPRPADRA